MFSGISIAMAISVPIYYYKSYIVAVSTHITLFLIGAVSYGISTGDPFINLSFFKFDILAKVIIYIPFSYLLSAKLFIKRDII